MNELSLTRRSYPYEVDGVVQPAPHPQTEFIVDGVGLGAQFGFEAARPWFGQTCFEAGVPEAIAALLGQRPPSNQFGSGRFVLYRCHCGSDYCGVISCVIERRDAVMLWRDIGYEGDEDDTPPYPLRVARLQFSLESYEAVVHAYAAGLPLRPD